MYLQVSSICAKHSFLQCKVVYKTHYTYLRLSRIYPNLTDLCNRCKQSLVNQAHVFWFCPRLISFWSEIFKTLNTAYSCLSRTPFGSLRCPPFPCTPKITHAFFGLRYPAGKASLPPKLERSLPPSDRMWLKGMLTSIRLERVRFSPSGSWNWFEKNSKFGETWRVNMGGLKPFWPPTPFYY